MCSSIEHWIMKKTYLKYTIPKIICYFCNKRKPSLSRLEQVHRLLFTYVVLATRHANKPVFYCVGLGFMHRFRLFFGLYEIPFLGQCWIQFRLTKKQIRNTMLNPRTVFLTRAMNRKIIFTYTFHEQKMNHHVHVPSREKSLLRARAMH